DTEHLRDGGLEPDLEEQDEDAQAGQHVHAGVFLEVLETVEADERQVAEDDPGEKLAEDGRLAEAQHEVAADFRGQKNHGDREDDRGPGVGVHAARIAQVSYAFTNPARSSRTPSRAR